MKVLVDNLTEVQLDLCMIVQMGWEWNPKSNHFHMSYAHLDVPFCELRYSQSEIMTCPLLFKEHMHLMWRHETEDWIAILETPLKSLSSVSQKPLVAICRTLVKHFWGFSVDVSKLPDVGGK